MNRAELKLGLLMVFNHTWEQLGKTRKEGVVFCQQEFKISTPPQFKL